MSEETFKKAADAISSSVSSTLSRIKPESVVKTQKAILSAKRIFVYGVGRSGLVGKAFAMRLVQMGLESYFIGETITPIVKEGDVIILISNTGATMSAIQTANIGRRQGAMVVAVTASPKSKMAHASSILLEIPVENQVPESLAPLGTKFEDATLLALDALISLLMEVTGETDESMRLRHAILV